MPLGMWNRLRSTAWVRKVALWAAVTVSIALTATAAAASIVVREAALHHDGSRTRLTLEFSARPDPAVFVVADPPRIVVDVPNVEFHLSPASGAKKAGLVAGFRFGLLAPGRSRLVIDVTGPVAVESAGLQALSGGRVALALTIVSTTEAAFRAAAAASVAIPGAAAAAAKSAPAPATVPGLDKTARHRPLIVIDPGHGGLDPGAVGNGGVLEKDIVLAVSQQLRRLLVSRNRYDVVMTRATDVFVPLDQRLAVSEQATADLFVSIHADSLEATEVASTVRGATVYTLSEKASDEQARRLAEKENAVDLLAGLGAGNADEVDPVLDILIDLLRRETANYSADMRGLLVDRLGKSIALSRAPSRSASFKVLRQTQTPSVLIELGYMSNKQDQALMTAPAWQRKVAASIAEAVDEFFVRRIAGGTR
jgi:N-acetylmuramoyl-L-alanine amidase